jgi:N-acyl-D-aspartate/D-glutamate deacylase
MHDLVIRNGLVVDGSGAAPFHADVAVDGDTISIVGEVTGAGVLFRQPLRARSYTPASVRAAAS